VSGLLPMALWMTGYGAVCLVFGLVWGFLLGGA
jgi:hypothetical protein